jgi:RNA polymerase sigma factor (sigma-70 family)
VNGADYFLEMNGSELLDDYRNTGSEGAFSELVRRYTNLVYSIAKRRLSNGALAEEVTQTVFARLAKAIPKVSGDAELVAWLHRTTVHVAIDVWRSETRRRTREQHAAAMEPACAEDDRVWEEIAPQLDEALNELNDVDRQAVLLRFFQRKPMVEVGRALGVSEDAAKMRVSRAIERLRNELSVRGIACTVLLLATVLPQRAVEAAPAQLFASLRAIKLEVPTVAGLGGLTSLILHLAKSKAAPGAAAALALTIVAVFLFRSPGKANMTQTTAAQPRFSQTQFADGGPRRLSRRVAATSESTAQESQDKARFVLRVVDKETGAGLAGAHVRAAYFYAGGVGERHELQTDNDGNAGIPQPNVPGKNAGLNVFVGIEGYVPKAIGFARPSNDMKNYLLELDPALAVGGTVVDESGRPVPDVTMEASRSENYKEGLPNTDFQTTKVMTDADGRWLFRYVPREYTTVNFYLTCTNFAVTRVSVIVGQPESLNATVVIKSGFVVTGRVTDSEHRPVAHATVKEHHNRGYRKLSTETDDDGVFRLAGLAAAVDPEVELVVQAKGLAPQLQSVQLLQPTNSVNFILAPGNVFRGRVVDGVGDPISEASVRTDYNYEKQIETRFEWQTHTDAEGRFEWDSAPADEICFWFEADGYDAIRGRPMLADGSYHEIKLTRKGESPK